MIHNNYSKSFDSFIYYGILVYLSSLVFEGPIRYFLYSIGMTYLIYLRDLFLIFVITGYIFKSLVTIKVNRVFIIVVFIFIFHSIIAYFYVSNILMSLFAWKTYLLLFFGIIYGHLFFTRLRLTVRVFSIVLIGAVIGVIINYYIEFPWEGLEYRIGGVEIEAVRSWVDMFGLKRLSGFARSSYDAAAQIFLLALFIFFHVKNNFFKLLIWLFVTPALFLTTTKGIIISFLLVTMFFLTYKAFPSYFKLYRRVLFALLAMAIILPFISLILPWYHDVPLILESFFMRVVGDWPEAFTLVKQHGNILLGRGLGGMGTSQLYFELQKYNSGDNIFLLFYGNLGLFGVAYLLSIAKLGQSLDLKSELFYFLFVFSFFSYGIVTSCIDNAFFCLFLGVFLGYVNNQELRTANRNLS